jgi:four helix bundle protein
MEGEKGKGKKGKGESSSARRFRPAHYELEAWKTAMRLVGAIYRLTASFPVSEQFGLTAQMRRAAISAPSNIAEGAARAGNAEMARYCTVARASLMELDTQLWLSQDLGMCADTTELRKQTHECIALINGLIRHRQAKINKPA